MIGIIGAMSVEIEELKQKLSEPVEEYISGVCYTRGKLCGKDVVLAVCGIGKVFAAICAQTMILKYSPEYIINTGVGGALDGDLHVTDVVVATDLVQHDMDTTPLGDPHGLISGINVVNFPADAKLSALITECVEAQGIRCKKGIIASGDQFIAGGERKEFIKKTFSASACEMEGASIAQVAYVNSVPFAVVRAISDGADGDSSMDYSTFVAKAAHNSALAIEELCKRI
jgi:adenosylhomocysteine nucleosidase